MTVTASAMATLQEVSGGRMDIGMGRGDSARRVIGQKPVTVEEMEHACGFIKDLAEGREVDYDGTPLQLKWSERPSSPGLGRGVRTEGAPRVRPRRRTA